MKKFLSEKNQKAQGMVEFALVLPILLLIILGIIGFGHLFFAYSTTVSASREAARFGSAVGVTSSGIPRFQACDEIIASAVQIGSFAGVNTGNVAITYDHGPGGAAWTGSNACPAGGTGPNVVLGDRIIVNIVVPYRSIVPLVPIPNFNLTATTRRTIVRSLQIGDAPTAEPICPTTNVFLTIMGEDSASHTTHSVVGQSVPFEIDVAADTAPHPTTVNSLYLFDSTLNPPVFPQQVFNAPSGTYSYTYWNAGDYLVSGQYVGDIIQCFDDSALSNQLHVVEAANTILTIDAPIEDASYPREVPVVFDVTLGAVSPGVRLSWEGVTVDVRDINNASNSCLVTLNAAGMGSCPITFNNPGPYAIQASYVGDANYKLAIAERNIEISEIVPTLITPVATLVTPSTPVPTVTPQPETCPSVTNITPVNNGGTLSIRNNSNRRTDITQIIFDWPVDPPSTLQQITLGTDELYYNDPGASPRTFTLGDGSSDIPDTSFGNRQTRILGTYYSRNMTDVLGDYRIRIYFSNDCSIDYTYTRR